MSVEVRTLEPRGTVSVATILKLHLTVVSGPLPSPKEGTRGIGYSQNFGPPPRRTGDVILFVHTGFYPLVPRSDQGDH